MKRYQLPVVYDKLAPHERRLVREQYIEEQEGLCWWCGTPLIGDPHLHTISKYINWDLFPSGFKKYPIHLQHDHETGLTEGAVHMKCNAVMWQYHGK